MRYRALTEEKKAERFLTIRDVAGLAVRAGANEFLIDLVNVIRGLAWDCPAAFGFLDVFAKRLDDFHSLDLPLFHIHPLLLTIYL